MYHHHHPMPHRPQASHYNHAQLQAKISRCRKAESERDAWKTKYNTIKNQGNSTQVDGKRSRRIKAEMETERLREKARRLESKLRGMEGKMQSYIHDVRIEIKNDMGRR
ncbi:hypothetical protein BCR34DRAFT_582889 [Clohesyomyces aquaticus]|uniref:Uncharacterized protein n=1 Tax=Clohesyomyces aquaticus TaxID=1231657 RepID=A0A1Y2A7W5_9PLEO|nr:hypothetical protein BCR34DRAFT_582889 [Clohesyomyces aquaticus]